MIALENGNGNGNGNSEAPVDNNLLRRLERSFDSQEREYQKTRDDVFGLKNQQNVIQRDIATLTSTVNAVLAKIDERAKPNWTAIALAVTMFIAIVPGMGFVMTTYVNSALSPIANMTSVNSTEIRHTSDTVRNLENLTTASAAADINSRADRDQINGRVRSLETIVNAEVADRRTAGAATKVSLAEIESQFHAISNVENLRAAQQERINSILWEKSHPGDRYPNGTFFPTSIFRESGETQNSSSLP